MTIDHTAPHWLVTVTGADKPGIIAAIATVLAENEVDVEDVSMTRLSGNFAMILLARGGNEAALRRHLIAIARQLEMKIHLEAASSDVSSGEPNAFISAAGPNRVGIVAGIARALADHDVNILEMSTRLLERTRVPVYLVQIECRLEGEWPPVADALASVAEKLGIDLRFEPMQSSDL